MRVTCSDEQMSKVVSKVMQDANCPPWPVDEQGISHGPSSKHNSALGSPFDECLSRELGTTHGCKDTSTCSD